MIRGLFPQFDVAVMDMAEGIEPSPWQPVLKGPFLLVIPFSQAYPAFCAVCLLRTNGVYSCLRTVV